MEKLTFLLFFVLVFSCAKDEDEALDYIREANLHLSKGECSDAIDKLAKATSLATDPFYIKTLASARACPGDFTEVNFVANDIDLISSDNLFNSFATFSTSNETEAESDNFGYLTDGIEAIIETTEGGETSDREALFGNVQASELNMQLLFMMLVHTGKWLQFYGNSSAVGTKGEGSDSNICFYNYTNPDAIAGIMGAETGSCEAPYTGHSALNIAGTSLEIVSRRVCYFIVNINHLLDIVLNTSFSSNDSLGSVSDIASEINDLIDTATALDPDIEPLFDFYHYADCIDYATTGSNFDNVELYMALFLEANFL